jgi:TolB protein
MRRFLALWLCSLWLAAAHHAAAQVVRVNKSAGGKVSINWTQFGASKTTAGTIFLKTVQGDLVRSGWFVPAGAGAAFTIVGQCSDSGSSLDVKCTVYDAATGQMRLNKSYRSAANDARRLAHQVADEIVEAITGRKGMASGRLVVVGNRTGHKELYLCDYDGQGLVQLTKDGNISIEPKWGPDGSTIIYTAFLKRYPDVYTIDVSSGARRRIAGYPGLNAGGAIAPNGREAALVLSKDGGTDLYIKNLKTDELVRLTRSPKAAEASPSWSPDGNQIAYVSDQSGSPQVYVMSRSGGTPKRITSRGSENVAPEWGPGGLIAYSSRLGGSYQVFVTDPNTLESRQVSPGDASYEDPCWAPDGRHLAASRVVQYRSKIYLLDTLGDAPIALLDTQGDWYSPSWSSR